METLTQNRDQVYKLLIKRSLMTQVWRLILMDHASLGVVKRKQMRDVPSQCQPADSLIVFERRVFEQEKLPGSQPVSSINTDTHQTPDCRHMHMNTEKGWLLECNQGDWLGSCPLCNLGWLPVSIRTKWVHLSICTLICNCSPHRWLICLMFLPTDGTSIWNVWQIELIFYIFFSLLY